ncbi:uncharacterized protein AB675_10862 [Cyphellophora attinorum]|uniref:DSBA-like thioredoxin domain-containing protein n=1 Tax=Cyphellophora attinorum TaxID=1664694 RepID=A0A0N1HAE7_9EURO|nr:uncharacterized protein AB675_10862 [Phialophora attinorum]KPI40947.1 hypothetical protein AB675_10862 [Phialophora attinorum]
MSPQPTTLDFHYDISCPFAHIASLLIPALQTRHPNLQIAYRPVLLGAIYRATAAPQGAAGSASDTFNPTKRHVTSKAFVRTKARLGVVQNEPKRHPMKTTGALRLLYCVGDGKERVVLTKGLYDAYWVRGMDVSDVATLKTVVRECGDLAEGTRNKLLGMLEDGSFEGAKQRRELEETTNLAVERGAFGVPAFWIEAEEWTDRKTGQKKKGRLYWGQDRLQFVEKALFALERRSSVSGLPRLESLVPRAVAIGNRKVPDGQEAKMEFWYDFSSPWAFLGWTQLARLKRIFGSQLKIEMKPFLLGILFREIGAPNTPMAAVSEAKRIYSQLDHSDWTKWWNDVNHQEGRPDKNIDFYWADIFPIRTPTVLRAVLAEPKLVDVLFRACWERNKDMSSDEILREVIAEAGYDADAIMKSANSAEIKQDLRARTKEAKDIGICGVPSYRIFRRQKGQVGVDWKLVSDIIWGQDDIAAVEDLISGWDGQQQVSVAIEEVEGRGEAKSKL